MLKTLKTFKALSLFLLAAPVFAQTPQTPVYPPAEPSHTTRAIARGVELIQDTVPNGSAEGPLVVTTVRADPRVTGVRVEAALGGDTVWGAAPSYGREIVSKLATRRKAVAGINAGFFPFMGNPIGLHIENGDLVTEPANDRTSFYVLKNGTTGFAAFGYNSVVMAGDKQMALEGLNRSGGQAKVKGGLLLFTPIFGTPTPRGAGRFEVVLRNVKGPLVPGKPYAGIIAASSEGGNTPIAKDTVVLSAGSEEAVAFLKGAVAAGVPIAFRVDVNPLNGAKVNAADIAFAVTGSPRIVSDGRPDIRLAEEHVGESFSTTRHPRTAIGRTRDGVLFLVTVDGRQAGFSRGASLPELADLMIRMGAVDALNLDGGGSSVAVVRDAVVNSPSSSGVEREIADALLVFADDLPASPGKLPILTAPDHTLTVGEMWDFGTPSKQSANERAVWGTKGGVGFVSQTGVFRATRPGKGTVFVSLGRRARTASVPVTIVGAKSVGDDFIPTLKLTPDVAGNGTTLTLTIANVEGDPLANEPVSLTITGGSTEQTTVKTDAKGKATVRVQWDNGAKTRTIRVTSPQKRFRDAETSAPSP